MNDLQDMETLETLIVQGQGLNVLDAHNVAWAGLKEVLGSDPEEMWSLKVMEHVLASGKVQFQATFLRSQA